MNWVQHSLLIVEDDPALHKVVGLLAEAHGFRTVLAGTCESGIRDARAHRPDAAIVDLGLPDRDGICFIESVRTWSNMPIIVLSARAVDTQLSAFDAGADDFVVKPFSSPELFARVKALIRRTACDPPESGDSPGGIFIDTGKRVARRWDGAQVRLTPLEHRILEILARHPDRVVVHQRLLQEVWGTEQADMRALRLYVMSLRRKLERDPSRPVQILTESGVGYRLASDAPQL
ncbi:MAG: response regulator transcription factor [Steroidobacteraceae bacterium]|jgi:two-component system KDP operon response regulator KdpE